MKKIVAFAFGALLVCGLTACSSEGGNDSSSSDAGRSEITKSESGDDASNTSEDEVEAGETTAQGQGALYQEFPELQGDGVLFEVEDANLHCRYDIYGDTVYNGRSAWGLNPDEGYIMSYGYNTFDNLGVEGLEPSEVFSACEKQIIDNDGFVYQEVGYARSFAIDHQEQVDVNGWTMEKYVGSFDCDGVAVPFVGYAVVNGGAATWCIVGDNTPDQSLPLSTLEDRAGKVAHTYRNLD